MTFRATHLKRCQSTTAASAGLSARDLVRSSLDDRARRSAASVATIAAVGGDGGNATSHAINGVKRARVVAPLKAPVNALHDDNDSVPSAFRSRVVASMSTTTSTTATASSSVKPTPTLKRTLALGAPMVCVCVCVNFFC